jgi:hypothetical protein
MVVQFGTVSESFAGFALVIFNITRAIGVFTRPTNVGYFVVC